MQSCGLLFEGKFLAAGVGFGKVIDMLWNRLIHQNKLKADTG
jgi:hypothetical protein